MIASTTLSFKSQLSRNQFAEQNADNAVHLLSELVAGHAKEQKQAPLPRSYEATVNKKPPIGGIFIGRYNLPKIS
ncbi:TPA: hypothetical protein R4X73_003057 [Citrobacter freundii]|uniref:hypothetical protein n=1 Tax=Klebsiella oxytoca TaxID=571 RepID=UPI002342D3C5|nr:hypothetical protein [Klebsiella oxytoca]HED2254010.1 hypothetical protein [Citrobacter freundii]